MTIARYSTTEGLWEAIHAPGVYGNMPEAEYHADPSLGYSSLKNLLISPLHHWLRSPLCANHSADDSTPNLNESTLIHDAIVSGFVGFEKKYVKEFNPADYPGALDTMVEIREHIKLLGERDPELKLPPLNKNKEYLAEWIAQTDPNADVMLMHEREYLRQKNKMGKIAIPIKTYNTAMLAKQAVAKNKEAKAFLDPEFQREVSIFWIDPETGCPCKCRVDILAPHFKADVKTFSNPSGIPLKRLLPMHIANYRYDLQAFMYGEGVALARKMEADQFHDLSPAFVDEFRETPEPTPWYWIFVGKDTPNVRIRQWAPWDDGSGQETGMFMQARGDTNKARQIFMQMLENRGTAPWWDEEPIIALEDGDLPGYYAA